MIIVKLMGGLGNQMFQYAAGRSLACRHNARLKLDISFLESDQKGVAARAYELRHLNISADIATPIEVAEITGCGKNRIKTMLVLFQQITGLAKLKPSTFLERHFHFNQAFLTVPDNTYLEGYWQSEKYFKEIEETIRREFVVRYPLEGKNLEISEKIKSVNSVSIHVRRGDYVTNPETSRIHGVCGLEYYLESIKEVSKKVSDPHFFIFSDDMEWGKENLKTDYPVTYVDFNGPDNAYEDMRLMSLCRHNIIANSSFSWWGAWLNKNPEKIVIAPKRWFNKLDINADDLIPETWIRL